MTLSFNIEVRCGLSLLPHLMKKIIGDGKKWKSKIIETEKKSFMN